MNSSYNKRTANFEDALIAFNLLNKPKTTEDIGRILGIPDDYNKPKDNNPA